MALRAVAVSALPARVEALERGEWRVECAEPLAAYPRHLLDRLVAGAAAHPGRTLAAERNLRRDWKRLSYAEALAGARAIGQGLLERGLSAERPLAIVLDNGLELLVQGAEPERRLAEWMPHRQRLGRRLANVAKPGRVRIAAVAIFRPSLSTPEIETLPCVR